jgi:conflict system STAND superfamily ATPase
MNEIERPGSFAPAESTSAGVRGPFVGTRPFSAEEAVFFFGREREATRLANLIIANTLTVLYGDSGVGKSSLINARLPRALDEIEPDWLAIPFFEWQLGCEKRLQEAVEKTIGKPATEGLAKALLGFADKSGRPVLLVLDQFEEYFLYHPHGISGLDAELAKLINRRVSPVRVLFSLRSDGLFLLDRLRLRIPNVFASMMSIDALDERAAIDCVVRPLQAYNDIAGTAAVQVPARDSDLVGALVSGADEEQILLRLPGRGRSELERDDRRSARIVAPFLQMALDELWQEDVVNSGRDRLELATLRQLAGLAAGDRSWEAVGAIAQKYVDSILRGFSDEEKAVCALILERMVLPSGQKVAVKLLDLSSVLTDAQQDLAVSILGKLSSDQTRRLIKMVAGVKDSEPHYQILHDAMAIPLLGWVEQWKSDDRAAHARKEAEAKAESERVAAQGREARARRRAKTFGILAAAAVVLVIVGAIGNRYWYAKTQVDRLTSFADKDPRSGFRLPLLFSLGALEEVGWWPINTTRLTEVLRTRLLRSPRDGGSFSAMGFDPETSTIAWIDRQFLVVCDLRRTPNCNASSDLTSLNSTKPPRYALGLPSEWYAEPPDQSRNPRLGQNQFSSLGFVTGLDTPVIYRRGLIYSWDGERWIRDDLADLLPDLQQHPGMIVGEILGGGLRITFNDWPSSKMWATHLAFDARAPGRWVQTSAADKWLNVAWLPGSPSPVISTNGALAVYIFPDRIPGGGLRTVLNITSVKQSEVNGSAEERVDLERIEKISAESGTSTSAPSLIPAGARPGLGFTADNQFLAVLYMDVKGNREVKLLDLSTRPVVDPTRFEIARDLRRSELLGNPFSFPPVAAVKVRAASNTTSKTWRFAWLTRGGVRLLEGDAGGVLRQTDKQILLSGIDSVNRLDFSTDGEFLVMQSSDFGRRAVSVRVWDVGPAWKKLVDESKDWRALRQLACRVIAIDTDQPSFVENFELQEWRVRSRPCPDAR